MRPRRGSLLSPYQAMKASYMAAAAAGGPRRRSALSPASGMDPHDPQAAWPSREPCAPSPAVSQGRGREAAGRSVTKVWAGMEKEVDHTQT